jgi:hypothetical protein
MRRIIKWTIPFAAVVVLAACGSNESSEAKTEGHEGHNQSTVAAPAAQPQSAAIKDDNLNAVYQHYIHLRTALTNGDVAEAKVASNAIEAGAKEVQGGASIASSAAKITAASSIEAQRTAFSTMSNDMIALVKKSGLKNGELYVEFCPMAFNDKGAYWLSSDKEIKNPYFGDKMLECGEVKETIQ